MRRKILNKKGDVGDFMHLIVVIFIAGLMLFVGIKVWGSLRETFLANPTIASFNDTESGENSTTIMDKVERGMNILDPMFAVFFFGFFLAILVSIFYLDTHPGFMIFGILLFVITIIVAGILSDSFLTIANTDQLVNGTATYPITYHIMQYMPIYLLVMGAIFFIILYASRKAQYG